MAGALSRYWTLWCIDPAGAGAGFRQRYIASAEQFWQAQQRDDCGKTLRSPAVTGAALAALFCWFESAEAHSDRALAGLCLRCYVSEPILNACRQLDSLFGGESFTYRDLLPFVLNDDGKKLIVLDRDRKTQLVLTPDGDAHPTAYKVFSVQVLQTFRPHDAASMSLDSWAYLQTKQNSALKQFIAEYGFKPLSDWALLNRARPTQIDRLSPRDRHLVQVFHAVYRRDRRQQRQGSRRCLDPTVAQLQEMVTHLKARGIAAQLPTLLADLQQVALQFRQYDLWRCREPLELTDLETDRYGLRADLPSAAGGDCAAEHSEQQALLTFFYGQLHRALAEAIQQAVGDRLEFLSQSKGYAALADRFLPGLSLYYHEHLSLKQISAVLSLSGWAQARRLLNPGELLSTVRALTIRQVLDNMLKQAQAHGLTSLPPQPDYLKNLAAQIEALADADIFQAAFDEIRAGKNRQLTSVYAQQLCAYLNRHTQTLQGVTHV
ncbi:hypothetical protein Lepto7375DRAFT_1250 [Leptolyngbya sp. PCC 7375]|nr:hypothetical protein Lepto7375DRAFT_1250 [Leptolyngbya sp. PCC 7375]